MAEPTPLDGWSERDRDALTHEVVVNGWMRHLPPVASLMLVAAAAAPQPPTLEDLQRTLRSPDNPDGAWEGPARDAPAVYTDEDLAELDEAFPNWVDRAKPRQSASEANAEERVNYEEQLSNDDRYAAHYGLPPLRTAREALDLLLAAKLLFAVSERDTICYRPAWPLPLLEDVLPLSEEERTAEDKLRWDALHETTSYRLIELFEPDSDDPPDRLTTSLARLSDQLSVEPDSLREAIPLLMAVGDFTATADVARVSIAETFDLVVDWELFNRLRISIRSGEE